MAAKQLQITYLLSDSQHVRNDVTGYVKGCRYDKAIVAYLCEKTKSKVSIFFTEVDYVSKLKVIHLIERP